MVKCPKCGKMVERLLALSRDDNKTSICDMCGTEEAMAAFVRSRTPQERTRAKVRATGNKWANENFEATHS